MTPPPSRSENRRQLLGASAAYLKAADLCGSPDQCPKCRGVKGRTFSCCPQCRHHQSETFDGCFFATAIENPGGAYQAFETYKSVGGPDALNKVAAILSGGFEQHQPEIEGYLKGAMTVCAAVPSTRPDRPPETQLLGVAIRRVGALKLAAGRYPLRTSGVPRVPHSVQPGLFVPQFPVKGERILLVEDVWASGGTALTALIALRSAGARVALLVAARLLRRTFERGGELIDSLPPPKWLHVEP